MLVFANNEWCDCRGQRYITQPPTAGYRLFMFNANPTAAANPDRTYHGGQTITVHAELHQIPLFIRSGSKIQLGDLNREFTESLSIAQKKPYLRALDAEAKMWFISRH